MALSDDTEVQELDFESDGTSQDAPPEGWRSDGSQMSARESIQAAIENSGGDDDDDDRLLDTIASKDKGKPPKDRPSGKTGAQADKQRVPGRVQPNQPTQPQTSQAPTAWAKEARDIWDKLPPQAQAAVTKREQDHINGVNQLKQHYQKYDQTLQQLAPVAQKRGTDPATVLDRVVQWGHYVEANPALAIVELARAYNVDLGLLAGHGAAQPRQPGAQQGQPQQFQMPPQLQQHLNALQQQVQGLNTAQQRAQQEASDAQVASWAKDKPHYQAVRQAMSNIVRSAIRPDRSFDPQYLTEAGTIDLDKVYDQAVFMNPETRALAIAEQAEAKRAEARKAREKASRAAVSVRAGAVGTTERAPPNRSGNKVPTARDSIYAAIAEHRS